MLHTDMSAPGTVLEHPVPNTAPSWLKFLWVLSLIAFKTKFGFSQLEEV
jgi:hypothetical protein